MARASLRDDLHGVHARLTAEILAATSSDDPAEDRVAAWEASDAGVVGQAAETLTQIVAEESAQLPRLSVALRVVRSMLASR